MNITHLLDYFGLGPTHFGEHALKHSLEAAGIKTQVVWSSDEYFLRNSTVAKDPLVLGFKLFIGERLIADSLTANSLNGADANLLITALQQYVESLPMMGCFFPQSIVSVDHKEMIGDILMHPVVFFFDRGNVGLPHTAPMVDIYRMEVWELSGMNSYVPGRVLEAISKGNFGYLKVIGSTKVGNSNKTINRMVIPRKGTDMQTVLRMLNKAMVCKINVVASPFIKHIATSNVPITADIVRQELSLE
jgi:hypothetical protein